MLWSLLYIWSFQGVITDVPLCIITDRCVYRSLPTQSQSSAFTDVCMCPFGKIVSALCITEGAWYVEYSSYFIRTR